MGTRERPLIGVASMLVVCALAACGSRTTPAAGPAGQPLDSLPAVALTTSNRIEHVSATTAAERPTVPSDPADADAVGDTIRIDLDGYQISGVVPADAGPDPMGEFAPPDFVIDSRRWMTDCCWLMLTIQNERPLHSDEQLVETVGVNGLDWAVYDTQKEGFLHIAVTTVDEISISVATQQRFDDDTLTPAASQMVRSMVDTIRVMER